MGMADWGGGVDYSGLFAGLARQYEADVREATARAVNKAEEEQAADDAEKYDQWKNGLISDKEWIAYLEKRVRMTKDDPKEHQRWVETLREHESAIQDAQMESRFETGEISIHRLIAHYQSRMKGVKKNSPAYREWASRYSQLVDARDGGYGSGGSGGSGGGSYWPQGYRPAGGSGSGGRGDGGRGGRGNRGPVDPINSLYGFGGDFDTYMDGLFGDLDRIDAINAQIERGDQILVDPLTGEQFQNTPEIVAAIDRQYLRTQDMIAAGKWADGDRDGATQALKYRSEYISTIQEHNSMAHQEAWQEAESTFFAGIVAGSQIEDPEARAQYYAGLKGNLEKVASPILGEERQVRADTTEGVDDTRNVREATVRTAKSQLEAVDPEMALNMEATLKLAAAWGDPSLSLDQRAAILSDVIDNRPYGYRFTAEQIQEYSDGNAGVGLVGAMETHVAREGLAAGTHAFFFDGQAMRVVTPEEAIRSAGVDEQSSSANMTATYMRVNGRNQRVWVQTLPVESDLYAYEYTSKANGMLGEGSELAGILVPSSSINAMSKGDFDKMVQGGFIQRVPVSPPWRSVVMPDGRTWYEDPETGMWYDHHLPVNISRDAAGGLFIDDDGTPRTDFSRFASAGGVFMPFSGISAKEMQRIVDNDIAAGLLDPNDFASRDETGTAQRGAPSTAGMYWDPADRMAVETDRELHRRQMLGEHEPSVFAARQDARIKSQAESWVRETLTPKDQKFWRDMGQDPVEYASSQIARFGERLGIAMMNPSSPRSTHLDLGDMTENRQIAAARRAQLAQQPQLDPVRMQANLPDPERSTGEKAAPRLLPPPVRLAKIRTPDPQAPAADRDSGRNRRPNRRRSSPPPPVTSYDPGRNNFREG